MNLGVLFALVASPWGFLTLDAWIAMAIAGYLLFGALQIGRESLNSLMDKELPSDKHDAFLDIAKRVEGVMGVHDLRTRQSGGTIFIQLHLELDDNLTLIQAHNIGDRVEANLLAAEPNADILVHLDPISVVGQKRDPVKFHN